MEVSDVLITLGYLAAFLVYGRLCYLHGMSDRGAGRGSTPRTLYLPYDDDAEPLLVRASIQRAKR